MRFICETITVKNGRIRIPHRLNVAWLKRIHGVVRVEDAT